METVESDETPFRFNLTELAVSVLATSFIKTGKLHGVACMSNEIERCVVVSGDLEKFCQRVNLTATATKANRLVVLYPTKIKVPIIAAMYHRRKSDLIWTYMLVNNCLEARLNIIWYEHGWWLGGDMPALLDTFRILDEEPTEAQVKYASTALLAQGGHEKLSDFLDADTNS